jgi:hypothetical protein
VGPNRGVVRSDDPAAMSFVQLAANLVCSARLRTTRVAVRDIRLCRAFSPGRGGDKRISRNEAMELERRLLRFHEPTRSVGRGMFSLGASGKMLSLIPSATSGLICV